MKLNYLVRFGLPLTLILTTAIVCFVIGKNHHLFIPISQKLTVFALILPTVTAACLQGTWILLKRTWKIEGQLLSLPLLALIALQIIYETIIATISLTYITPKSNLNCALSERWQELYSNKNEQAIRTIQDNFNCCGFKSVRDRAWPFSSNTPSTCANTFGRSQSCLVPWRRAEQINAGLLFSTIAIIFISKVLTIVFIFTKGAHSLHRLTDFETHDPNNERRSYFGRLLIKDNNPTEAFRDNEPDQALLSNQASNNDTPASARALMADATNQWVTEGSNN